LIGNSYGSTEGGGYNSSGEENFKGFIDEVRLIKLFFPLRIF
jgi:hypothetical protein